MYLLNQSIKSLKWSVVAHELNTELETFARNRKIGYSGLVNRTD
jgi:hypothetical protein